MSFKALVYAYVLGGLTFLPLLVCAAVAWTIYTSVPVGDPDPAKLERKKLSDDSKQEEEQEKEHDDEVAPLVLNDQPRPRKGWLTVRRTFEEKETDGSYVNMMRTFLDSRSKDPKRSRPKDMWYVVLKGNVLYLYEDESMTECEAAIQVSAHEVVVYPEGLMDGELFTKRNAICLKPLVPPSDGELNSVTREMGFEPEDLDKKVAEMDASEKKKEKERARLEEIERIKAEAKSEAFDNATPWFIFVRSCVDMEDWYMALVHAANYSESASTLEPVRPVFLPADMNHLVTTLDEQPDVIPMRWLNALLGRLFFSFYRTKNLESFIIGRLMKKLSKVKTPTFLQNISVTEVSVGNTPPTFSKPMLKDLTKEGDAALEIRIMYKGEIRLTVEATAIIDLGQRFKTYSVKLVLAVVLRRLDGNLLVKVKRPPTNRIWYAFTSPPEMDLDVEPVVSDRQIKWGMICSTIESRLKEIINESVVLPNMDDIAFFESSQYMHRGGIWADASRKSGSASGEEPEDAADQNGDGLPRKSHSVDAIPETVAASTSTTASDPVPEAGMERVETGSAPALVQDPARRRSWFGNASGGETSLFDEEELEDDRGRSLNVDAAARRATSVPASKSSLAEGPNVEVDSTDQSGVPLSVESSQDSSSAHSRMRSLSSGASVLGSEQANGSHESLTSRTIGTTNTSSFLSTLKSKADKQAISNLGKETMRKWSANWNGFKQNRAGTGGSEDLADGAPQSSSPSSSLFAFQNKSRNYADIRAAVTGRKDQGPPSEQAREANSNSPLPINIPNKSNGDEAVDLNLARVSSASSSREADRSLSSSPQSSSPKGPSLLRKEAGRAAVSPPRLTTDTHSLESTSTSTSSSQPPSSLLPAPEPPVQAPPIKTQPSQGAMMTIPGIHASHRGDVQSLGYVPPAQSTTVSADGKLRAGTIPPTIQSVYRLFRSPTTSSSVLQQQQEHAKGNQASNSSDVSAGSPRHSTEPSTRAEANDDVVPLSLTPSPSDTPGNKTPTPNRPAPPPLPPRSAASPAPSSIPPPLPSRREAEAAPSVGEADIAVAPSASDALRLIAKQDDTKRKDIESSPELKPKSRAKRTSLGAKRITSTIISDEPESMRGVADAHGDGEASTGPESSFRSNEISGDSPTQLSETLATTKPKPPPLPPRKSSAPIS